MKDLKEYLAEGFMSDVKNKIKDVLTKIKNCRTYKELQDHEKWLEKFTSERETITRVTNDFDITNQEETGVVLGEYGGLEDLLEGENTYSKANSLRELMSQSSKWQLCKNNEYAWFLPALEAWGINVEELDENAVIESFRSCYKR